MYCGRCEGFSFLPLIFCVEILINTFKIIMTHLNSCSCAMTRYTDFPNYNQRGLPIEISSLFKPTFYPCTVFRQPRPLPEGVLICCQVDSARKNRHLSDFYVLIKYLLKLQGLCGRCREVTISPAAVTQCLP